ncbi:MAG TPA: SusC/RagA family TonB-linked outer membrane protein, partial [Chitinophagaceae bacterium]|nr:SusC/RagA family TonB-linked outer membrane protein [Chitinophagaceae bacterium]
MKLSVILLTVVALQVSARGHSQSISFSGKNVELKKVFAAIEKQTDYVFFYDAKLLHQAKPVTIDIKNGTVEVVLQECFKDQPLSWTIVNKTITIIQKPVIENSGDLPVTSDHSPLIDVRARIVNENREPVIATVSVKGTKNATSSDDQGFFVLKGVQENATLAITASNIETVEIPVNGRTDLGILYVRVKVGEMEEVIINKGYYNVRQRENTGNVSVVKGADIQKQPISDPIKALQGLVPGVYIQQQNGVPGGNIFRLQVRGTNNIASGNNPLVIVDGMPIQSTSLSNAISIYGAAANLSPFNSLNTADIENIQVLKDADATAIYGSRGANGVILITTRKGKAGKTICDVNFYRGNGNVTRFPKLMNTQEYLQMRREAFKNDGVIPTVSNAPDLLAWDTTRYTDWKKALIGGTANITNIQGSLSGGDENNQFFISGGYMKQTTVYPGDFYDQNASVHINATHSSSNKKLKVSFQSEYSANRNFMPSGDVASQIIFLAPNAPELYLPNGNLNWQNGTWINPLFYTYVTSDATTNNLISSLNLSYQVIKGLQIRSLLGYNDIRLTVINLSPITAANPAFATNDSRSATWGNTNTKSWIVEPQIEYGLRRGKHNIQFLFGTTFQENKTNTTVIAGTGFTSDALLNNISLASTKTINRVANTEYHLNKFYGRIGYDFTQKILLNLTGSREGSSRFGTATRFGNFGAIGAGYIFTNEKFIQRTLSFLSFGKIRGSYGITGNDQITDYQYLSTYSGNSLSYQGLTGLNPTSLTNPYFGWEEVKKLEFGIDLGFLNDRIFMSGSYFRNRTANQLVGYSLPATTGFATIQANLPAVIQNSGLELILRAAPISNKTFKWETDFNITFPKNKLISFKDFASSTYSKTYVLGMPLTVRRLLHYTGIDANTGIFTFQDFNGDGVVTNPGDYQQFVPIQQKFFGGLTNKISYKNIQLDFLLQFVNKNALNYFSSFGLPGRLNSNQIPDLLNRWQKQGDPAPFQKFTQSFSTPAGVSNANMKSSDLIVGDASFIRLRTVSVSYSVPLK